MALLILIIAIIVIAIIIFNLDGVLYESQKERAGRKGEEIAYTRIKSILRKGDHIFTNIEIVFDGKETELDFVIVNRYGIFIIEVKNFNGDLVGREEDRFWRKYKHTDYDIYEKSLENPIKQVKREVYILSNFLKSKNIKDWVYGYVYLINGNRCTNSEYLLRNIKYVDKAIHTQKKNLISEKNIRKISTVLEK